MEKKLQLTDAAEEESDGRRRADEGASCSGIIEGDGDEDEATRKDALFEFRKARLKEMEDALTADQKTAWTTMLGDCPDRLRGR